MLAQKGATKQRCAVATNSPGEKTDTWAYAAHGYLKGKVAR